MLTKLHDIVNRAKDQFRADLVALSHRGGMTKHVYLRYLSFQYHLTKGVQRHFLAVAAHPSLAGRRKLRDFLYNFALEEEPHYGIAEHDLSSLGATPSQCPLDVRLWWAFFDQIVHQRPFVRLGATCVLENLGAGAGRVGHELLEKASFLNDGNTRFLQIHFHEELPHGELIFAALESVRLTNDEVHDLQKGAEIGAILYLRMARWAMEHEELTNLFGCHAEDFERTAIDALAEQGVS